MELGTCCVLFTGSDDDRPCGVVAADPVLVDGVGDPVTVTAPEPDGGSEPSVRAPETGGPGVAGDAWGEFREFPDEVNAMFEVAGVVCVVGNTIVSRSESPAPSAPLVLFEGGAVTETWMPPNTTCPLDNSERFCEAVCSAFGLGGVTGEGIKTRAVGFGPEIALLADGTTGMTASDPCTLPMPVGTERLCESVGAEDRGIGPQGVAPESGLEGVPTTSLRAAS